MVIVSSWKFCLLFLTEESVPSGSLPTFLVRGFPWLSGGPKLSAPVWEEYCRSVLWALSSGDKALPGFCQTGRCLCLGGPGGTGLRVPAVLWSSSQVDLGSPVRDPLPRIGLPIFCQGREWSCHSSCCLDRLESQTLRLSGFVTPFWDASGMTIPDTRGVARPSLLPASSSFQLLASFCSPLPIYLGSDLKQEWKISLLADVVVSLGAIIFTFSSWNVVLWCPVMFIWCIMDLAVMTLHLWYFLSCCSYSTGEESH